MGDQVGKVGLMPKFKRPRIYEDIITGKKQTRYESRTGLI